MNKILKSISGNIPNRVALIAEDEYHYIIETYDSSKLINTNLFIKEADNVACLKKVTETANKVVSE